MGNLWNFYLVIRTVVSPIDFITDVTHAVHLLTDNHPIWGTLTLLLPLFALLMSTLYVLVGRCQRGDPMSAKKFSMLTVYILTQLFEALFESIPQLILQCTAVWRGVVKFEDVFKNPDFFGVFGLISMLSSFLSILITASFYNDEKWDGGRSASKFLLNFCINTSGILYRIFIASLLFAVTPYWAVGISFIFFLTHCITFKIAGHSWSCLLYSYTSLLFPSGHTKQLGESTTNDFQHVTSAHTSSRSMSEVRRARLNQESLLKQVRISHGVYNILNLIALIAYVALIETHLFNPSYKSRLVIMEATNRLMIYLVPISLLIMNAALSWVYTHHIKTLRDAVRTWDAITPSIPASRITSRRSTLQTHRTSLVVQSPSSPPPPYEQQLPLNPNVPSAPLDSRTIPEMESEEEISSRSQAKQPGNRRCDSDTCVTCDLLNTGTTFRSTMTGKEYKFMPHVSCHTKNIIYLVTCKQCKKQYVGKTAQTLKQRHYGHRREIDQNSSHLGQHFAGDCGYVNFSIQIIDHTNSSDGLQRREGYWQHELMTLLPWGLNTRDELSGVDVMTLPEAES